MCCWRRGGRSRTRTAAVLPDLGHRGLDTPFAFTLTLPQWGTEHVPAGYLDARAGFGCAMAPR